MMSLKSKTLEKSKTIATSSSSGTATFRLDGELLEWLREESGQKRTSMNTLVSQILQSHAEYHTFAAKGGMISMSKNLLIQLLNKLEPQEVIELSEHIAKNELKDTIMLMKSKYTPDTVLEFIDSWARVGGYPYRHHIENNDGSKSKHSFVIQHDMGERWSLYFVEQFKFAFGQLGVKMDFQYTANTISFEVEV